MKNTPNYYIIIPARYASSRLPGKPLLQLANKPLIQHVYERVQACGATAVFVATDHPDIQACAESFGAEVVMTSATHRNGSERLAEAVERIGLSDDDIVVNVQGDEPLIPIDVVQKAAAAMNLNPQACVATFACAIHDAAELWDPNIVKVILDAKQHALYFSRAPIPWDREEFLISKQPHRITDDLFLRHLGLYAYRVSTLKKLQRFEMPEIEKHEQLEQLRLLYHGEKIIVECLSEPLPSGVDTFEDLARVEQLLMAQG